MVQIQRYLTKNPVNATDRSPLPLLNSFFTETLSDYAATDEKGAYKQFMRWARRSPAVIGFLNIIATDILSDDITFEPINERRGSGKNRIKQSEEFWKVNKGAEVLEETIYDMLTTGIGYNWKGTIKEKEAKEICRRIITERNKGLETKEIEFKADQLYELVAGGEVSSLAKKLRHVPSSTMSIKTNAHEVTEFIQRVGVNMKKYSPEEILQFKLIPFDGKPYPLPPLEVVFSELYLLWLITQNNISFFENGGHPDKIFVLPKEIAGSRNHKMLVSILKKYKKIQNKHGNLVFTGDIKVEDLMKVESQMQHKDLGLYIVGVLAMFYGIPVGRIPFLVGKAANNGDAGGLADSGYWRKISVWQSKIEETYNSAIFEPHFRTRIKFSRGYKQDEVRETQTAKQKTDIAEQRIRLGLWDEEAAASFLGIDPDVLSRAMARAEERKKQAMQEMQQSSGMLNQGLNNNGNVQDEPDKRFKNKKRQDSQMTNQTNAGGKNINP